jgi:hypothetical protein
MLAAALAVALGGVDGAGLAGCIVIDGSAATAPVFTTASLAAGGAGGFV